MVSYSGAKNEAPCQPANSWTRQAISQPACLPINYQSPFLMESWTPFWVFVGYCFLCHARFQTFFSSLGVWIWKSGTPETSIWCGESWTNPQMSESKGFRNCLIVYLSSLGEEFYAFWCLGGRLEVWSFLMVTLGAPRSKARLWWVVILLRLGLIPTARLLQALYRTHNRQGHRGFQDTI